MGVPLQDGAGAVIGHLAVLDTRPMPEDERLVGVLQLFAERAAAELARLRAEQALRDREELCELASFDGILGRSPALVSVLREIALSVARRRARVLVAR
jgi:GAF domain-containing protein